jgi:NitT/TauT family transport system permease protein
MTPPSSAPANRPDGFTVATGVILAAIVIIAETEALLIAIKVPQYAFPLPAEIGRALLTDFPLVAPHLGAAVGLVLAAVVTQFPFINVLFFLMAKRFASWEA